ncbi:TRL-like family protein [Silvanigrella aquatica]|uniref:Uncharacterized protein n=1 Tax=Silvanigrella aquatica TaxID=1915309 RepID=A0A1L4D213_9BACT|nr:TRL-like family protein [Silvanigrella aquatica]APJ04238.1 hypothetical protein AXG55_10095 [Silvanigrella aquatica]
MEGVLLTNTSSPVAAISNVGASKTGKSCAKGFLGFALGKTSLDEAMKNGNITKISYVEREDFNFLLIAASHYIVVKGE